MVSLVESGSTGGERLASHSGLSTSVATLARKALHLSHSLVTQGGESRFFIAFRREEPPIPLN